MEKDAERRFESADAVVEALSALEGKGEARPGVATTDEVSLAVLPFVNESADPEHEYLSEGITDTLIDNLSQLPRLRVIARATVFRYGNADLDPVAAGKAIGVGAVLTGRLRRRGEELVIRAELVDTGDGTRIWGKQYRRPMTDMIEIEEEISREITDGLRLQLAPEEKERLARPRTENPDAYRQYLKGRHVWNRWKTPEGMRTAIAFFEKALEIDPLYALAFAGLADSYNMLGNVKAVPPGEAYPAAKTAAMQGLAIDECVAELHASLGFIQRFWEWDWPAAEASFERAIELNPGYATAFRFYAQLLAGLARFDEAIEIGEKGLALDPLSPMIRGAVGDLYFYARRYETAIEYYRFTLEQEPEFLAGHTDLARAYELVGRYEDAIAEFETAAALAPKGPPEPSSGLAHVYAQMGEREKALAILGELLELRERKYVSPYGIASIHACLGDVDKSLDWLETAYDEHDQTLVWLKVHPRLDPVRGEPRYRKLLEKMKL
jgi:TolB-like protein/Tfp pilus assembly protein PilF